MVHYSIISFRTILSASVLSIAAAMMMAERQESKVRCFIFAEIPMKCRVLLAQPADNTNKASNHTMLASDPVRRRASCLPTDGASDDRRPSDH